MLYLTEGDYINAGLSALSIILGADAFTKTGKASKVLGNGIVESGLKHLDNVADGIKKLVKKADDAIDLEKHLPKKLLKEEAEAFAKKADKVADDVVEDAAKAIKSGLNSNLLDELDNSGVKYNPEDIVAITKTADGKLVWLENGTDTAGLNHIITEHADDFLNKGITQEQIPDYVMNALENGKIVGYQGRGTGRPIYEFTYNGEIHKVAITVGNNGFIVGANPK